MRCSRSTRSTCRAVPEATTPRVVALLNLSRDQMDRAAEIWLLAQRWREAFAAAPDAGWSPTPTTRWSPGRPAAPARSPGWRRASGGTRTPGAARSAARTCAGTTTGLAVRRVRLRAGPSATLGAGRRRVIDPRAGSPTRRCALPGRANRANAVIALAVAEVFGVGPAAAAAQDARGGLGRRPLHPGGAATAGTVRLLLAKNPAGWLEAFDVLDPAAGAGAAVGQRAGARRQGHLLAVGRGLPRAAAAGRSS